jgi:C4-dicarboxylate-specific signal transduction histidine kinase
VRPDSPKRVSPTRFLADKAVRFAANRSMRRFWALPLRRQLLIAILLLLVPVLVAAIWSGLATFEERRQELGEQARIIALTTASYINRDLANQDRMAERLAKDPAIARLQPAASRDLFNHVVVGRAPILRLALVDQTGAEVAFVDPAEEPLDASSWAAEVFAKGRRVIEPARLSPSGRVRYITLGYPVTDESGALVGALGVYLNLQSLRDAFDSLSLTTDAVVAILDRENRVLVRSIEGENYVGRSFTPVRGSSTTPQPTRAAVGLDGITRMYGEAEVAAGPWLVSVGIPTSLGVPRAVSLWARSSSILVIGLAGWLMVALVLSRRLGESVGHLDRAAKRIAAGDFSPIQHQPMLSREFTDLQVAFDLMLRRFNDTRQALDTQMAEERRMRSEVESLQGQVIRQERLAAVGQLVSGVAHEINNPLQAILGFAELLQMQDELPESVKADLRLIQKESARACGIIRNLALFARQQPGEAAPLRLGAVITSVAELRQRRLESEDIRLLIDDRSSECVNAVLTELQQVVLNFVVNAEQSIIGSGRLPGRVIIRTFDRDDRVVLEVEDTGRGVSPEHEARLFEPFFTTKPVGQGTGLGLSVSYGIIDSLGGHIGHRRAPAGGSIFYFDLPAVRVTA